MLNKDIKSKLYPLSCEEINVAVSKLMEESWASQDGRLTDQGIELLMFSKQLSIEKKNYERVCSFMQKQHKDLIKDIKSVKYVEPVYKYCGCCKEEDEYYLVYLKTLNVLHFDSYGYLVGTDVTPEPEFEWLK